MTDRNIELPLLVADKPEYTFVAQGYQERQAARLAKLKRQQDFNAHISVELPWWIDLNWQFWWDLLNCNYQI